MLSQPAAGEECRRRHSIFFKEMEEDEVENNISENLEKGNGKRDNKMASMPVNKLMLSMGIPMILSMALQAVYNIVDSAFVSNMKGNG